MCKLKMPSYVTVTLTAKKVLLIWTIPKNVKCEIETIPAQHSAGYMLMLICNSVALLSAKGGGDKLGRKVLKVLEYFIQKWNSKI